MVQATLFPADPLPGSEGASGSGCAPGAGPLPSGIWYGHILAAAPGAIEFDLACFYFGEIAWEVAAGVGEEANNDYWKPNSPRVEGVVMRFGVTPDQKINGLLAGDLDIIDEAHGAGASGFAVLKLVGGLDLGA